MKLCAFQGLLARWGQGELLPGSHSYSTLSLGLQPPRVRTHSTGPRESHTLHLAWTVSEPASGRSGCGPHDGAGRSGPLLALCACLLTETRGENKRLPWV